MWQRARVLERKLGGKSQQAHISLVEIEPVKPPAGVYLHMAREDDTLSTIVHARYRQQLEPSMLRQLLAIMPHFQTALGGQNSPLATATVPVNKKLQAHTPVALPQLYVSAAGDTPVQISYRFGVALDELLKLNAVAAAGDQPWPASMPLREKTLVVLPKALPDACAERAPIQPMAGPESVMPPPPAFTAALRVGESVWISANLPGEGEDELRPAVVTSIDEDMGTFDAGDIAGDAGWTERSLQMTCEGKEWVRACAAPSVYESGGSGALLPPYCEWRTLAGYNQADAKHCVRPRPPPPAAEWFACLKPNDLVEVLWDGAWQRGSIMDVDKDGRIRVGFSEGDEETDGLFHGWQLRPPIADTRKRPRPAAAGPSGPSNRRQRTLPEGPEPLQGDNDVNEEAAAEAPGAAAAEEEEEVQEEEVQEGEVQEGMDAEQPEAEMATEYKGVQLHLSGKSSTGYKGVAYASNLSKTNPYKVRYNQEHVGVYPTVLEAAHAYALRAAVAEAAAAAEAAAEEEDDVEDADEMDAEGEEEANRADDLFGSGEEDEEEDDEEEAVDDEEEEDDDEELADAAAAAAEQNAHAGPSHGAGPSQLSGGSPERHDAYDDDALDDEDDHSDGGNSAVDLDSQPPRERERIELSHVQVDFYSELASDPVTGQPMPIGSIPPAEKKQARDLLRSHFCRQSSSSPARSYNAKLIDCMLEKKLPQGESTEYPQNLNAANAHSISSTSCDELSHLCVGLARCDGDVIGVVCFSLVPQARRKPCCAAEIMLFRVGSTNGRSVERQGVGGKLFAELLEWISRLEESVTTIVVLSAEAASADDNWWIRRLEKRGIKWAAAASQRELVKAVAPSGAGLPKAFWLPWPMQGDDGRKGNDIVVLTITSDDLQQTLRQEKLQRLQQTPSRPLRVLELGAYSGKLTLEFLEYGWDGAAIERDPRADVFASFQAKGKSAHVKLIDIAKLTSLKGYDYVHVSLNCVSNTLMAQSTHRRNEGNEYDGESPEAREFNRLVKHVMDLLAAAKLDNPAFAFTFEQPKSVARQQLDIRRRFDDTDSRSACCPLSCLKRSAPCMPVGLHTHLVRLCSYVSCAQSTASAARSAGASLAAR